MSEIFFTDFKIKKGKISFNYKELNGESGNIYFHLTPAITPKADIVALALSTLCGKQYSKIYFDLRINSDTISKISNYTEAKVSSKEEFVLENESKKRIRKIFNFIKSKNASVTLNFSGGFDSLAAKCLMPKGTKLVSMDFGGNFSREREFFKKFNTCIVSTNLLETPLRRNSWAFMGIASILFSDYLNSEYYTFGGILEAGIINFYTNSPAFKNPSFPPFSAAGMKNAPYVIGLTEVGTIKVLAHFNPKLISKSLDSLANPGEEKRYRKQVLAKIWERKIGKNFGMNIVERPPVVHFKFGQNFAADFLSFYIIKNAGLDIASHTISDIPSEVVEIANRLSLEFYEKVNPNFVENFPKALLNDYLAKLEEARISMYNEKDWQEFNEVRNLLSKYYEIK